MAANSERLTERLAELVEERAPNGLRALVVDRQLLCELHAIAYLILCVGFRRLLPGSPTVPEQIKVNPYPYWDALKAADAACSQGRTDVSKMERVLTELLQIQLTNTDW